MMKWMSFSSEEARDIGMRIQTKCTIWALLQFARTQIHSQERSSDKIKTGPIVNVSSAS
jgi:hypothetical protein